MPRVTRAATARPEEALLGRPRQAAFLTAGVVAVTAVVFALVADQLQRRQNRLQRPAGTQFLAGVPPAHHAEDRR